MSLFLKAHRHFDFTRRYFKKHVGTFDLPISFLKYNRYIIILKSTQALKKMDIVILKSTQATFFENFFSVDPKRSFGPNRSPLSPVRPHEQNFRQNYAVTDEMRFFTTTLLKYAYHRQNDAFCRIILQFPHRIYGFKMKKCEKSQQYGNRIRK